MTIEITAPDGTIVDFPDGTPDNVIIGVMAREYGGPATPVNAIPAAQVGAVPDRYGPEGSALRNINALVEGFNLGVEGTGRGLKQAGLAALDALLPGQPMMGARKQTALKQMAEEQEFQRNFPDSGYGATGQFLGRMGAMAPAMPLMPASPVIGGAVAGGLEAFTRPSGDVQTLPRRAGQAVTGAATGAVAGKVMEKVAGGADKLFNALKGTGHKASDLFTDMAEHGIDEQTAFTQVRKILGKAAEKQSRVVSTRYTRAKELGKNSFVEPAHVANLAADVARQADEAVIPSNKDTLINLAEQLKKLSKQADISVNNLETIRSSASGASRNIWEAGRVARQIDDFIIDNADDPRVGAAWKSAIRSRRQQAIKFEEPKEIADALGMESMEAIEGRFLARGPLNPKIARIYDDVIKALPEDQKEPAGFLLRQSVINKAVKDAANKVDDPEGLSASFLANRIRELRRNNPSMWNKFKPDEKIILNTLEKDLRKSLKGGPINRVGHFLFKFMGTATRSNLEAPRTIKPKTIFTMEDILEMTRTKPTPQIPFAPAGGAAASAMVENIE